MSKQSKSKCRSREGEGREEIVEERRFKVSSDLDVTFVVFCVG